MPILRVICVVVIPAGHERCLQSQWHMMLHSFDPDKMDVSGMDKEELQQVRLLYFVHGEKKTLVALMA